MSEIAHLFVDVTVETVFMRALCTTTEAGYCQIVQVTLKNTYYVYMTVLQDSSKVHIISHSMGNRVTSEACLQYKPAGSSNLGQLIFAAIDIKASLFSQRLAGLSALGAAHP